MNNNKEKDSDLRNELMSLLIDRGRPGGSKYIKLKLALWDLTVRMSYFIKRGSDILFSFTLIVILSPVYLFTAILIKLDSSGPVIFKQTRVGKNGRHFDFYKFRSMRIDAEKIKQELMQDNESEDGVIFKMKKDPRITRVGRFIRKFSIDELPQLFNVLVGDMSLVGPRPPLPSEVAEYTLEERKRLHITPGITCIWQVSGRSDIPFKQQVELDKEYIKSRSLWKDILILLKTIPAVLTGKGAY
jgi:exopolysaccharide biosynthesis polyprenyl glycosylphosphotransferase